MRPYSLWKPLYLFPRGFITDSHKLGDLKAKKFILVQGCAGWKFSQCAQGQGPCEGFRGQSFLTSPPPASGVPPSVVA